jgi:hypothetical protein
MRDALEQLNTPRALEQVDALLDRAGNNDVTTVELLDQLLGAELTQHHHATQTRWTARRQDDRAVRLRVSTFAG